MDLRWLLLAGLTACYAPRFEPCAVACGAGGVCPEGTECVGGYCLADRAAPCGGGDGGGGRDGGPPDGAPDGAPRPDARPGETFFLTASSTFDDWVNDVSVAPDGTFVVAGRYGSVFAIAGAQLATDTLDWDDIDGYVAWATPAGFTRAIALGADGVRALQAVAIDASVSPALLVAELGHGADVEVEFGDATAVCSSAVAGLAAADGSTGLACLAGSPGSADLSCAAQTLGRSWVGGAFTGTMDFGRGAVTAAGADALVGVTLEGIREARVLSSAGNDRVADLALLESGDVALVGYHEGIPALDPPTSASAAFVAVMSPEVTEVRWSRSLEGLWAEATAVGAAAGGLVVAGGTGDGVAELGVSGAGGWVARYGAGGSLEWARGFPVSSGGALKIEDVAAGGGLVAVVGWLRGTMDLGGGVVLQAPDQRGFVAALEPNGALRWAIVLEGFGSASAVAVAVLPDGHVVVGGGFSGSLADPLTGLATTSVGWDSFLLALPPGGPP